MRIIYIGCVKASYIELKILLEQKKDIVAIITKESSIFNSDFVDLKPLGEKYNIPSKYADDINDLDIVNFIKKFMPDVIYCFGWSQIIKENILKIPKLGVIGTHPTQLPYNRGRHPIIWALALGLESTASTFFVMDEKADTGDIISQKKVEIDYKDYAKDLYDKITQLECEQIIEFTEALENGTYKLIKQDKLVGNIWRKRIEEDGKIDWRMSSRGIYNLVRALSHPYIGAYFMYKEKKIKVWRTEEIEDVKFRNIEPGKIIKYNSGEDFYVKAYDNIIHVVACDEFKAEVGEYL